MSISTGPLAVARALIATVSILHICMYIIVYAHTQTNTELQKKQTSTSVCIYGDMDVWCVRVCMCVYTHIHWVLLGYKLTFLL